MSTIVVADRGPLLTDLLPRTIPRADLAIIAEHIGRARLNYAKPVCRVENFSQVSRANLPFAAARQKVPVITEAPGTKVCER